MGQRLERSCVRSSKHRHQHAQPHVRCLLPLYFGKRLKRNCVRVSVVLAVVCVCVCAPAALGGHTGSGFIVRLLLQADTLKGKVAQRLDFLEEECTLARQRCGQRWRLLQHGNLAHTHACC